jgi:hypothetical protein
VHLHEARRAGRPEKSYYVKHLEAWRDIRDAVATTEKLSTDEAHRRYNDLLKTSPATLAAILRAYAGNL